MRERTKKLLKSLRFIHLGFAFFWTIILITSYEFGSVDNPEAASFGIYTSARQIAFMATVIVVGFLSNRIQKPFSSRMVLFSGLIAMVGLVCFFASMYLESAPTFAILAGVLLGCSSVLFIVLWQQFYVSEGSSQAALYIALSAALSALLYLLFSQLDQAALVIVCAGILPLLATGTLYFSTRTIESYTFEKLTKRSFLATGSILWRSTLCVCVLALGRYFSSQAYPSSSESGNTALIGFFFAAVIISFFELTSEKRTSAYHAFRVVFFFVAIICFLSIFSETLFMETITLSFSFSYEVCNLLLLVSTAMIANRYRLSPITLYALFASPAVFCLFVGSNLFSLLASLDLISVTSFAVVVLFAFAVTLSLTSIHKKPHKPVEAGTSEQGDTIIEFSQAHIDAVWPHAKLTAREEEIVQLLLRANTIPGISKKLFISENTVRGHVKSIYRKLGVHSRQELVDGFEKRYSSQ